MAEYTFIAAAIVRLEQIIDLWPIKNRAETLVIERLAKRIGIRPEDHAAISWQPGPDNNGFLFDPIATLTRELDSNDVEMLKTFAEHPPERLAWRRQDRQLQHAVFEPLGLEPWFAEEAS